MIPFFRAACSGTNKYVYEFVVNCVSTPRAASRPGWGRGGGGGAHSRSRHIFHTPNSARSCAAAEVHEARLALGGVSFAASAPGGDGLTTVVALACHRRRDIRRVHAEELAGARAEPLGDIRAEARDGGGLEAGG